MGISASRNITHRVMIRGPLHIRKSFTEHVQSNYILEASKSVLHDHPHSDSSVYVFHSGAQRFKLDSWQHYLSKEPEYATTAVTCHWISWPSTTVGQWTFSNWRYDETTFAASPDVTAQWAREHELD